MEYVKELEKRCEELQDTVSSQDYTIELMKNAKTLRIMTLDKKHWHDRDQLLFHSVFTVLVEFIEKEWKIDCKKQLVKIDRNTMSPCEIILTKNQNKHKKELFKLYLWWKNEYPKLEKQSNWFIKGYSIETGKAMRVIALRKYLWT